MKKQLSGLLPFILLFSFVLTACNGSAAQSTSEPQLPATETLPAASPTPEPTPTPTPIPAALTVNGIGIPIQYFQDELTRYLISFTAPQTPPADPEAQQAVIEYLTEQLLLASAAQASGLMLTDEQVQTKVDELTAKLGSAENLVQWTSSNYYSPEEFRFFVKLGAEAALQRDAIIASIPDSTEQVRARQIFTINEAEANQALSNLQAGMDFGELAARFSPETAGELGWFPRGYLLFPQIEEAAFSLEPGAYSQVIQTEIGYHIVQVTEKDPNHPLTTDAKLSLQSRALANWLADAKTKAQITTGIP